MRDEDIRLLHTLEDAVAEELNRHLGTAQSWMPHEYVPWDQGRNFNGVLDGEEWSAHQSKISEAARLSLVINLLTEDNLPSYHHSRAELFGLQGAWGEWLHRWTAEEGRHSIAIRDYLLTSRSVDPVELEELRMTQLSKGHEADASASILHSMVYLTVQELATRMAHRNTGSASGDPICDQMMARIAKDENLHMLFYRNLLGSALEVAPDRTMVAFKDIVTQFRMPGHSIPGFQRAARLVAVEGIYNLRIHHDDVLLPILRKLRVLDLGGLGTEGAAAQEELGAYLSELSTRATRFDEVRAAILSKKTALAESGEKQ
ncbi:acyl-ACP desaturase [Streptomyces sp. NBC_01275]|uniref:acyl-ACP desaturase n=1 Tax=Streptomyces sp. NBC_01275 TaxID=2903807 RepID=UPI00224D840E|nr:acyl-ACP desaturase [Streptomyces sp. NBC_01275]MCX4763960.1 acyl-ACP desaturase [Streptomyces sp. NBC_01275]